MSFNGFKFIKKIDITAYLKSFIEKEHMKNDYEHLFCDDSWVNDHKRCFYTFMLNNNQDVVIKIKQN